MQSCQQDFELVYRNISKFQFFKIESRISHTIINRIKLKLYLESDRRDGVVVRASASQSVDLGFIPLVESYQKTLKNGIRSFLLGARHLRKVVENKPASSLVVSLGKALNGTPHLYVEDRWPINLEKGNSQASADFPSKV